MRTGAVLDEGTSYRLHVHVLADDSPEIAEFRTFRDRLRADPDLVATYTARKRHIIATGITDAVDYAEAKGAFCRQVLASESA